jgi:hypothetical protein
LKNLGWREPTVGSENIRGTSKRGEGGAGSLPLCGNATVDGEFLADDIGAIRDVSGTVTQS